MTSCRFLQAIRAAVTVISSGDVELSALQGMPVRLPISNRGCNDQPCDDALVRRLRELRNVVIGRTFFKQIVDADQCRLEHIGIDGVIPLGVHARCRCRADWNTRRSGVRVAGGKRIDLQAPPRDLCRRGTSLRNR